MLAATSCPSHGRHAPCSAHFRTDTDGMAVWPVILWQPCLKGPSTNIVFAVGMPFYRRHPRRDPEQLRAWPACLQLTVSTMASSICCVMLGNHRKVCLCEPAMIIGYMKLPILATTTPDAGAAGTQRLMVQHTGLGCAQQQLRERPHQRRLHGVLHEHAAIHQGSRRGAPRYDMILWQLRCNTQQPVIPSAQEQEIG